MAAKRKLTEEKIDELFELIRKGHSYKDAGKKFGITQQTASKYYHERLHRRNEEVKRNGGTRLVVKRNDIDTLTFSVEDGYVGHAPVGGVDEWYALKAKDDEEAIRKFDEWLARIVEERAFLDNIERKSKSDEAEVARLRREVEELNHSVRLLKETNDTLNEKVRDLQSKSQADASGLPGTVYAIVAGQRGYGYFLDMGAALEEVERLDEVASFLDRKNAFELLELPLKQAAKGTADSGVRDGKVD